MQGEVDFRWGLLVSHRADGGIEIVVRFHRRHWRTRAGVVFHFDGLRRLRGKFEAECVAKLQVMMRVECLKPLNDKSPCGPRTNVVAVKEAKQTGARLRSRSGSRAEGGQERRESWGGGLSEK